MLKVKGDPRLTTADGLSDPQLKDHVPKLIAALIEALKHGEGSGEGDAKSNADKHGIQRWEQGYRLRELLLEIFWLRVVLFQEAADFAAGQPGELSLHSETCTFIDKFLNDIESHSVVRFVESNKAALHKANQETLRIIRIVSHELRNMLNSVTLASHLLEGGGQEAIPDMVQNVSVNAAHMTAILDDLLHLSNMLSGTAPVKVAEFDLCSLMECLGISFSQMAQDKGLVFSMSADRALARISGDELRIRQIIENLVTNAIKYTFDGEVAIRCEAVGDQMLSITVEDTGVGIAEADQELVFCEFYQTTAVSPLRGSGLGLWIVARLVELLHGTIELKSAPGKGSLFKVMLPLERGEKPQN